MEADRPMDDQAREDIAAWKILWDVRCLLLTVPVVRRRELMEAAIRQANASQEPAHCERFEAEVRAFMKDILEND